MQNMSGRGKKSAEFFFWDDLFFSPHINLGVDKHHVLGNTRENTRALQREA
jgi:hypothetical protein